MAPMDPKKILDALLGQPHPALPFPPADIERAQALARSEGEPAPAEVESLPEPLALALLELEVRRRRAGLADALAASRHKPLAKAGKKVLYQLRSMGIAVPEKPAPAAPPPPPAPAPEELPGILAPPAVEGQYALYVPRPMKGGGLEIYHVLLNDEGVVQVQVGETNRSAYRKQLREMHAHTPPPGVEVTRQQAREVLAEAAGFTQRAKKPLSTELHELLGYLDCTPQEQPPVLPSPQPEDERLATGSHLLHNEPEVQPWLPPEDQLRLLLEKLEQVRHSPLALSETQRSEQFDGVFRAAAQEFFTPERKRQYALRLWRVADFFERTGRAEKAQVARAEARLLFHGADGLASRFTEALFEKILGLMLRAQAGAPMPERHEPLVPETPTEEPEEKKSPGGIILP